MSVLPSTEQRRKRLRLVFLLVFGVGTTVMLVIFANREGLSWFFNPSQIANGKAPASRAFRVGGVVEKGSKQRLTTGNGTTVRFSVTDCKHKILIQYSGILPDMFTEGQVAVAKGNLNKEGVFIASEVLAKHDPKYVPIAVKRSLAKKETCNAVLVTSTKPVNRS